MSLINSGATKSWKGALATTLGLGVATLFIMRLLVCNVKAMDQAPWNDRLECAKSVEPAFKLLNDILIQLGITVGTIGCMVGARALIGLRQTTTSVRAKINSTLTTYTTRATYSGMARSAGTMFGGWREPSAPPAPADVQEHDVDVNP